jgi:aquaporin Z
MIKYLVEFIGTFIFISIILNSSRPQYSSYAPLAIGLGLAVVIQFGGFISGGHYNPAVSFSSYLDNRISSNDLISYIIVQILAAYVAKYFFDKTKNIP